MVNISKKGDTEPPKETTAKPGRLTRFGQVLNHDFCPEFTERYFGWLRKPIGWIICGALISGLTGLLIDSQGFVFMWSFIAFLFIGVVWPWLVVKGIQCELVFESDHAQEGKSTDTNLVITNRLPVPIFGLTVEGAFLQDVFCDDDKVVVALKRIPACSVSEFRWSFSPQKRGVIPGENPKIVTGFPFGMQLFEKEIDVPRTIIVWPRTERLESIPSLSGANFNISGNYSDRTGLEGDFIGARNYRHGDSLRNVNWKLSARYNRLVVLERQSVAQQPVHVILDLNPNSHSGVGSQSTYEGVIRSAAAISKQFHLNQSLVKLSCLGMPIEIRHAFTNQKGLTPFLDFLALLPEHGDLIHRASDANENVRTCHDMGMINSQEKTFYLRAKSDVVSDIATCFPNAMLIEIEDSSLDTAPRKVTAENSIGLSSFPLASDWERLCADAQ